MFTPKLSLASLTLAALPVFAFAMSHAEIDTNGDGMLSVDEVQFAMPDITTEMFMEMDSDGDGLLNDEEVSAAVDAGTLPMDEAG